jgi:hypothetical protein
MAGTSSIQANARIEPEQHVEHEQKLAKVDLRVCDSLERYILSW